MKTGNRSRQTTLLGLLTAILMVLSMTPLGYLNIGPLAISFNMIPVAVGAAALGPVGGAVLGAVFGMTSFLQCLGIGGSSAMGVILFDINPLFAFLQRFVPRLLTGFLVGLIYKAARKFTKVHVAGGAAGFFAAVFLGARRGFSAFSAASASSAFSAATRFAASAASFSSVTRFWWISLATLMASRKIPVMISTDFTASSLAATG